MRKQIKAFILAGLILWVTSVFAFTPVAIATETTEPAESVSVEEPATELPQDVVQDVIDEPITEDVVVVETETLSVTDQFLARMRLEPTPVYSEDQLNNVWTGPMPSSDASLQEWSAWWDLRVSNCYVLVVYEDFKDCHYRPWVYGY
jgi:hypothetical protein